MATSRNAEIPHLEGREQYFNFFDGITATTVREPKAKPLPGGLLKSYLLETVGPGTESEDFNKIVGRSGLTAYPVRGDDCLYRIVDYRRQGIALAEQYSDRYFALHTLLPTQASDVLVRRAVGSNPFLDNLWLSTQTFNALWGHVRAVNSGRRYGRITFEHESLFESGEEPADFDLETRASRFTMVDRLDEIAARMEPLQETYAPLHSIVHLRMPAVNRGGHDLYYDGKVTNRSDSFLDHRNTLKYIVSVYSQLTSRVEERLWFSGGTEDGALKVNGAVAEIVFSRELSEATFRRWVMTLFNNRRNRFRIGGFHTWLSPRKVQANAIDQHLWQPVLLELTTRSVFAVLPEGTCGNTINRLVSNIQRYVDPNVTAYIGGVDYAELVPRHGAVQIA